MCSEFRLRTIQAELTDGKLRFWFRSRANFAWCARKHDAGGSRGAGPGPRLRGCRWLNGPFEKAGCRTGRRQPGCWRNVDVAGVPCTRATLLRPSGRHPSIQWERESASGVDAGRSSGCRRRFSVIFAILGRSDGPGSGDCTAGPWGAGSPCRAGRSRSWLTWLPESVALRPAFGGQYNDHSRRGTWQNWKSFEQQRGADVYIYGD